MLNIETVNGENKTYTLGHNVPGMDEEEFSKYLGYSVRSLESRRKKFNIKYKK